MTERDCDKCKHTDTKSCRYPCSECDDIRLNKWEDPNSDLVEVERAELDWLLKCIESMVSEPYIYADKFERIKNKYSNEVKK